MQASTTSMSAPALPKARFNWIFPAEKFNETPSIRDSISADEELAFRQQAAVFIYELGTFLKVPHYCINTAVVYMHRFYMINSFKRFTRQRVCAASLFLACKVEEYPRTLRDVIENTGKALRKKKPDELTKEIIDQYADDIVLHENILLSTLGFSLMVDHPHPIIIKTIQTLGSQIQSLPEKTPRELAQTAYYLATKSILLTSFCVKYPPDLIACFCIHLAAAWLKIEIPPPATTQTSSDGSDNKVGEKVSNKRWFHLVNESYTEQQLGDVSGLMTQYSNAYLELADEFLAIYEKCPDKIKKKLVYQNERQLQSSTADGASTSQLHSSTANPQPRPTDQADSVVPQGANRMKVDARQNQPTNRPPQPNVPPPSHSMPTGPLKREPYTAPTFSSSGRPPVPSHNQPLPPPLPSSSSSSSSSSQSQSTASRPPSSYQHPSAPQQSSTSHYQNSHHQNNNYHVHSRYPTQQSRPPHATHSVHSAHPPHPPHPPHPQHPPLPPNRSTQQPPLPPPQHHGERKPPPPPHPYDHPAPLPPPTSSSNRPPYGAQQRSNHFNNVPQPPNPYPQSASYSHAHAPSLMHMGSEKRRYDTSYDPNNPNSNNNNNIKRPRPS